MIYRRIFYLAWLVGVLMLWILEGKLLSTIFLIATIFISIASLVNVALLKNKLQFLIEVPDYVKVNKKKSVVIRMKNTGFVPAFSVSGMVLVENLLTGEKKEFPVLFGAFPGKEDEFHFKFHSPYCGKLRVSFKKLICTDMLGICASSIQTNFEVVSHSYILPILPREYPAERIKKLMRYRNMQLFLETQHAEACTNKAAEAEMRVCKVLELSYGCSLRKIAHDVIFYNEQGSQFEHLYVSNVQDFDNMMEHLLSVSFGTGAKPRAQIYLSQTATKENHCIVINDMWMPQEDMNEINENIEGQADE